MILIRDITMAKDFGQQVPFLLHADLQTDQLYDDVKGMPGNRILPISLPAGDISGGNNHDLACFPGCACAGSELGPTVSCASLNLTDIPDGLSHLTTYL